MSDAGRSAYRRRVERAAELRSIQASGSTVQEKVDDAAKAEYLIRDAMEQGKFDNLKYAGKPIPGLGEVYDPDWWVKGLLQRENITGLGPTAILLRTEDAELDERLDAQPTEHQVRDLLADFNARVIDARRQLQGGPPVTTSTRDVDAEVELWRERRRARASAVVPDEPEPDRPWWRRLLGWDKRAR